MTVVDRAVLVTGANRGIGKALVEEALRRGAKQVYAGTRQPLAHPDERVIPLTLDVTDAAQIKAAVERVESLDVLINNAGIAFYDDLSDRAAIEQHLAVNLFGTYSVTQAFLPLLTRSRGVIANNVSTMALAPFPMTPGLAASTSRRPRQVRSRERSSTDWRMGMRRSSPIRCQRLWRRVGASVRLRRSNARTRCSWKRPHEQRAALTASHGRSRKTT